MKDRAIPPVRSLILGCILVAGAWALPLFLDGAQLAQGLLRANYSLPELMASYVPELRRAAQLTLVTAAAVPLLAFLAWVAETSLMRPTGPGQVARGWRSVTWFVIALIAGGAVYGLVNWETLGGVDSVDDVIANRTAIVLALLSLVLFWVFCLIGTERMIRPAVPGGALLVGRS